ncbi:hypothetical protein ABTH30_20885, partial [Acinetobacter baumannii]
FQVVGRDVVARALETPGRHECSLKPKSVPDCVDPAGEGAGRSAASTRQNLPDRQPILPGGLETTFG